jgi:hypothetical protein
MMIVDHDDDLDRPIGTFDATTTITKVGYGNEPGSSHPRFLTMVPGIYSLVVAEGFEPPIFRV